MSTEPMYSEEKVINTLDEKYMTKYLFQAQKAEKKELEKVIYDLSKQLGRKLRILDIGIGNARVPRILSGIKKIWDLVKEYDGFDNSKEMLGRARSTITQYGLENKVRLFELDAKNLSQLDKSYDLIICTYFTAGDFSPPNFSFKTGKDGKLKTSPSLEKNESFELVFRSAYNLLCEDGKLFLGSVYLDNESTRKKQEEFYRKCGMTIISRPTDSFTGTKERFWSQRFTPKRISKYFYWVKPEDMEILPLDKYDFAATVVVTKKSYSF